MQSGESVGVDSELLTRHARSPRAFFRALGRGSEGARVVAVADGVQATLVPARPWFSIFNSVFYSDPKSLRGALPQLRDLYADAGIGGWSVWVPPRDGTTSELLAREGHAREGSPLLMAAWTETLDTKPRGGVDVDANATWSDVARCNDRAHEILAGLSMSAVFEARRDPAFHLYAARTGGEVGAGLLAQHLDGDCYFWFVATDPDVQRRGLARELMRFALHHAVEAGCTSASLESTAAAERLYSDLGFGAFGRFGRWAHYAR